MGDMIDYFKAMKQHQKETRAESILAAQQEWNDFVTAAQAGGYVIQVMTEFHWNVYKNSRAVAQYWPSSNKWQIIKGSKVKHGSRDEFRHLMREGRL